MSTLLPNPDSGSAGRASSSRSPAAAEDRFEDDLELHAEELSQQNRPQNGDALESA
jgi:hypothetical protein